eukprot:9455789-Pyramimonas_sp.AAC.1
MDRGRLNHSIRGRSQSRPILGRSQGGRSSTVDAIYAGGRCQKPQRLVNYRRGAQPKAAGHR